MSDSYAYGDCDAAADRLDLVARAFEATTRSFLQRDGAPAPAVAIDLGCGPGNTTRLIAETLSPSHISGLDGSAAFVERARRGSPAGVTFQEHDVRKVPLPSAPADLIFTRLLLSHLPDPPAMVARWGTQLRAGGRLLLDEVEDITADEPTLRRYLALTRAIVRRTGAELFVGPALVRMQAPAGLRRHASTVAKFALPTGTAARIFGMNLAVLTDLGAVEGQDALAAELATLADGAAPGTTTWRVRQIAFRVS